jgi:alkaline phosphatase D
MEGKRSISLTGSWDTRISRRVLLRTGGSAAAGLLLLGRTGWAAAAPPWDQVNPFSLGVASGDPSPDGFVLWTRLLPEGTPLDGSVMKQEPYGVRYEIASDPEFTTIVRRGGEEAVWEESHTVHAEITGLPADRWYWYRFKWGRAISPVGRTRTAPAVGADVDQLRFAFASCQNRPTGYYHAYADLAEQDIDLVVHLGDYIYEGRTPDAALPGRHNQPEHECRSLTDYRVRHAQYKTEPELRKAHERFPWLATWDDHEVDNNYAGLEFDPDEDLESAAARRAAAYLAYWEHQPLSRSRKPVGEDMNLYRRAHWGSLATFHVLDTRQHRSDQIIECLHGERMIPSGYCPDALRDDRTMLGAEQGAWLEEGLIGSGASWNVLANQVSFAPDNLGTRSAPRFNVEGWDGYAYNRQRVLDFLAGAPLANTVVITGDRHYHAVRNVPPSYDALAAAPVATEFIGSSISSGGDGTGDDPPRQNNPHHRWKTDHRGYVLVAADAESWRADFRIVRFVEQQEPALAEPASSWVVENGKPGATRVDLPV